MKNTMLTIAFAIASTTMFAAQNPPASNPAAKTGTQGQPAVTSTKKPVKKVSKHTNSKKPAATTGSSTPATPAPAAKTSK